MWVLANRKLDITEYASLDGSERWSCWNSFYTEAPEETPTGLPLYDIVSTAFCRSRWLSRESDSTCVFVCNLGRFSPFLYATQAFRVSRGIALLFSRTFGTRCGWVVGPTPRPPLPSGKTWYPFFRRLGGSQGRSGQAENLVFTGIRSRTVRPVVSRYTDWAARPFCLQFSVWKTASPNGRTVSALSSYGVVSV
jgi:hypothetical protein